MDDKKFNINSTGKSFGLFSSNGKLLKLLKEEKEFEKKKDEEKFQKLKKFFHLSANKSR